VDSLIIERADPGDPGVAPLIAAHLAVNVETTPPESIHALGVDELRDPAIRFWVARVGGVVLGCGALKALADGRAEVKSVHTAEAARGRGVARALMGHLIGVARAEGIPALLLETGSMEAFAPARALYAGLGFTCCGPIPGYTEDPNSVFMALALDPNGQTTHEHGAAVP